WCFRAPPDRGLHRVSQPPTDEATRSLQPGVHRKATPPTHQQEQHPQVQVQVPTQRSPRRTTAMKNRARSLPILAFASLALVLAGCGDDGDDDAAVTTTA